MKILGEDMLSAKCSVACNLVSSFVSPVLLQFSVFLSSAIFVFFCYSIVFSYLGCVFVMFFCICLSFLSIVYSVYDLNTVLLLIIEFVCSVVGG